MPWHDGEPPRDGNEYLVHSANYAGLVVVSWCKYNGRYGFRGWDTDTHDNIIRWHELDGMQWPGQVYLKEQSDG